MEPLAEANYLIRLLVAMVLSGALGWERERADRPAGLRTHMTVGMASALFVVLAEVLVHRYGTFELTRTDPTRVLQAVVAGIAFLGAGTIFVTGGVRGRPRGLTTAASLLATSGVGVAAAVEAYVLAAGSTALFLVVLAVIGRLPLSSSSSANPGSDDSTV